MIVSFEIRRPIQGIARRQLTELGRCEHPFVKQNDTGTQGNPQAAEVRFDRDSRFEKSQGPHVRNVECGVDAIAGGSGTSTVLELALVLRGTTVCHG
jgi:hypothetical protein